MGRAILGVIAGYAVWTLLWLAGNSLVFAGAAKTATDGEMLGSSGTLIGILVLSVACSLAAGAVAAAITKNKTPGPVLIMAVLLLITGIGVQSTVWSVMPVWYHLLFLLLIVPFCMVGARLVGSAKTK